MIDLEGRVAIVTGAGGGLGRAHANLLAQRGARVVVNDLGDGADLVAGEINTAGGQAWAARGSVTDAGRMQEMVDQTVDRWGRVDILVNNAGILRDKSFAKMPLEDFQLVVDVHLMGAVNCTKAVWETMRRQNYGRIIMTTSSSGLYGNFGQSNYGAAKLALVGLMQTLALEGERYGIRVNCIAPTAATQMLEGILPADQLDMLRPELVSPAVLALAAEAAPTRAIICAGAGSFELANIAMTEGIHIPDGPSTAETLLEHWAELADRQCDTVPEQGFDQSRLELKKAGLIRA
ncbi:SDR family NAD(P)-dependent oxidoreductase [Maricaulis salignorans]|uniref:SDR family NAD(P)-dependent oxidoreductase n=1 Tax=Maricaulis salignorans TaxID=144026 RepID=UPI003A95DB84